MEKRKKKRIKTRLPEAIIHIIQSLLSEEEAARTTLISKAWYKAWLTRPVVVLVLRNLHRKSSVAKFSKFAAKTMRRYQDSNLKIESLMLKMLGSRSSLEPLAHKLILDAMEMGATDLKLQFSSTFVLPAEVLRSETLLRLSVSGCEIDENVNCSMLKSLILDRVDLKGDDKSFFYDLESRFPCLEDLSFVDCYYWQQIQVRSSSLKRISIVQHPASKLEFEVPNLVVFSYSGRCIPSFSLQARDEWESHISIEFGHFPTSSCYQRLLELLNQLSSSRINLTINIVGPRPCTNRGLNEIRAVANPVAVENLRIEAEYDVGRIMRCLFRICLPKLVTLCWLDCECGLSNNHSLLTLCNKLMGPRNGRKMFEFEEGKMEVYEEDVAKWQPLLLEDALTTPPMGRNVRFHLKW